MDPAIGELDSELTGKRPADEINPDESSHDPLLEQQPDEQTTTGPRSKRKRYTLIACNECKRRKIKCNGEKPCQRCKHLDLQCIYSATCCAGFRDSVEFVRMTAQIASLQEQVNSLFAALSDLRSAGLTAVYVPEEPPPQPQPQPQPQHRQQQQQQQQQQQEGQRPSNAPIDGRSPNGAPGLHLVVTGDADGQTGTDEHSLARQHMQNQTGLAGLQSHAPAPYAVMQLDDCPGEMEKAEPGPGPGSETGIGPGPGLGPALGPGSGPGPGAAAEVGAGAGAGVNAGRSADGRVRTVAAGPG